MDKLEFVQKRFPELAATLNPTQTGKWGKMNAQQMVEHLAESISYATGENNQQLHTPAEHVPKYREFMLSDKEFKENTKNALMAEEPPAMKTQDIHVAIDEYSQQVSKFVKYFQENKNAKLMNSIFGELSYEEWLHLFEKHTKHHAKQFGLI
jgi:oxepin-CoA hydrolase/3-oxo-5,6-dehydrosuberyl-CoA semialdehyde dehydrogenase